MTNEIINLVLPTESWSYKILDDVSKSMHVPISTVVALWLLHTDIPQKFLDELSEEQLEVYGYGREDGHLVKVGDKRANIH